jgi:uroporphyrin-III C-methyltransferase
VTVHLVGAGPGDPGLLTVRAAELLRGADVVVHDRLVSPITLYLAERAERIDVGKTPGGKSIQQERINQLLIELGRTGREVVRLKGGDPFVFGRGGEEAIALRAAGVAYTVVPGVTAAIAAPATAGIPVTHRHIARSVAIVTGREDPDGPAGVNWERLAGAVDTIVVLMGAARIGLIAEQLVTGGLDPATPLAAITRAGWPEETETRATLADAADLDLPPATTMVIGTVAAADVRPDGAAHLGNRDGGRLPGPILGSRPHNERHRQADQAGVAENGNPHGAGQGEAGAVPDQDRLAGEPLSEVTGLRHEDPGALGGLGDEPSVAQDSEQLLT